VIYFCKVVRHESSWLWAVSSICLTKGFNRAFVTNDSPTTGPGSGKGLLSERLVKECGVVHLSSGNLLREEVEAGTHLGKQVDSIMKSGGLVSSAIMVTLMQKKMKDHPGKRILLDGFPRSAENAKDLVTLCGRPELALHLDCDDCILIERILARGKSGARADDNIHTALQRIKTYHKSHQVTMDFLRDERVPIVQLDCSAAPDVVWEQLSAVGRLMRQAVGHSNIVGS
jgi:adenylate kinase family enzyme